MTRRLAAILIADVVGYTRLSQVDEEGTRRRFLADLQAIFDPKIAEHHGRLVKTMGDGILVEFPSVVDAVRCAVGIQRAKAATGQDLPPDRRILFRIGINLGDIVIEGDDIHGEGVNIAHRVQTLAEPGGIAVSGVTYDQVKYRADIGYAYIGEQPVKNIAEPIRVYRVLLDAGDIGKTIATELRPKASWRKPVLAAGLVVVVAASALAWLQPWQHIGSADSDSAVVAQPAGKPAIAVLPFENLSDDPAQAYFADGLTEDIITDLSKVSGLFVIARNTTFAFREMALPIADISRRLGVRYILEGSVRHAGDDVRINAQLIDSETDATLWAERFDGSIANVFSLQDRVTQSVVQALSIKLSQDEQAAVSKLETSVPAAYKAFLQGWHHRERTNPAEFAKAIPYFETAIRLDPRYHRAYAALALIYVRSYQRGWSGQLGISGEEALRRARDYLELARQQPTSTSYQVAGLLAVASNDLEQAITEFNQAIAQDAGDSWSYAYMALAQALAGNTDQAMTYIESATQLDPLPPPIFHYYKGMILYSQEDYAAATAALETATKSNPGDQMPFLLLAATYGQLDRSEDARAALDRFKTLVSAYGADQTVSIESAANLLRFRNPEDASRLARGLRAAGLPET